MDSKTPVSTETRAARAALGVVIVATACWSSSALGRTQPGTDCGSSLQALAAPIDTLVLTPVDHVPTEPGVSELDAINLEDATSDTGTPHLNLTPRVNDTLREIFDGDPDRSGDQAVQDVVTSPVAEFEDIENLSELPKNTSPVDSAVEDDDLPLLRRQMYRIDI